MNKFELFNQNQIKDNQIPELKSGYTVRVYQKIKEGDKQRIQVFEGLIIAVKHGRGINGTITVRRTSGGIGVERIFPIHAPFIEKIEIVKKSKVRRAKLYYIRHKSTKESRLTEIRGKKEKETKAEQPEESQTEAAAAE